MMADIESIINEDEFFANTVDTPKEDDESHRKLESFEECN